MAKHEHVSKLVYLHTYPEAARATLRMWRYVRHLVRWTRTYSGVLVHKHDNAARIIYNSLEELEPLVANSRGVATDDRSGSARDASAGVDLPDGWQDRLRGIIPAGVDPQQRYWALPGVGSLDEWEDQLRRIAMPLLECIFYTRYSWDRQKEESTASNCATAHATVPEEAKEELERILDEIDMSLRGDAAIAERRLLRELNL